MKKHFTVTFITLLLATLLTPLYAQGDITTIYLVRHAEKQKIKGVRDVPLNADGEQRARDLAYVMSDVELSVVYSTEYIRTKETARPTAESQSLPVNATNELLPETALKFLNEIVEKYIGRKILIVSHSDVVPIHAALLTEKDVDIKKIKLLADNAYDNLYVITIDSAGNRTISILKYGVFTPVK